jgi:hypothetical protein
VPLAHGVVQEPQCCASLARSTQAPLHRVCPLGQPQLPPMHGVPALHVLPQVPQFAVLASKSTHVPLHAICPLGQATAHLPCTHDSPLLQAAPHAPQSLGFVAVSAHSTPPPLSAQGWKGQVAEQVPLTQN